MHLDYFEGAEATRVRGVPLIPFRLSAEGGNPSGGGGTDVRSEAGSPEIRSGGARPQGRTRVLVAVGVGIVLVVVVGAYVLTGGFQHSSSTSGGSAKILIPYGTGYSMAIGQINVVYFTAGSESRLDASLNSSEGIQIYISTPAQFQNLTNNLSAFRYFWTSGVVAVETIYDLQVNVSPGQWALSFVNPCPSTPTGVGFYSAVTLTTI